jgi:hypothetical protein
VQAIRITAAVMSLLLAACTVEPVQPWEKAVLSRPEMAFDSAGFDSRYEEHIYTSREGSPAGQGVGGGGCGCN